MNSIILAFPSSPSELTLDHMTPIWKVAESFSQEGVAREVGVADLDKDQLEDLYNWASLKPKVNQVNVAHCCTIPEVRNKTHLQLCCSSSSSVVVVVEVVAV